MSEICDPINSNLSVQYALRFSSSDEVLHLNQEQIDLIPYLSALISHKDDFLSIENEKGEYILNPPIEYHSLTSILRSIASNNPYKLFDELPEDENVFHTLQLFDYLALQPFPLPFLKNTDLIRSKSVYHIDRDKQIEYHRANISEVRRTAAEFVVALAKKEYKLHDSNTMEMIFYLVDVILFNAGVFNLRFRDHTLVIAKECCYPFLSKQQRRQLEISHRLPQYEKIYSDKFENTFTWRGSLVAKQEKRIEVSCMTRQNRFHSSTLPRVDRYRVDTYRLPLWYHTISYPSKFYWRSKTCSYLMKNISYLYSSFGYPFSTSSSSTITVSTIFIIPIIMGGLGSLSSM